MNCLSARCTAAAIAAALIAGAATESLAQCSTCAQPAYAPVAQTAYMPVAQTTYSPVYQTSTGPRWYPGMYLRRLLGWGDPAPAAASTYTTAYQPTYPASYSVGYAPTAYTAGYAPTAYTVGYAPAAYSVGYAASCNSCGCNPCSCTAGYGGVTLSAVAPACSTCAGGAVTAGYNAPCPNCASGASQTIYEQSPANADPYYPSQRTPTPGLPADSNVPETRNKPAPAEKPGESSLIEGDEATFFQAPQLFSPQTQDRVTRTPSAPVWNAVYKQTGAVQQASATTPAPRHRKLDPSGWSAVNR